MTSTFTRPGGGTWTLDTGHFSADVSRICQDLITQGAGAGSEEGFALIGAPLKRLDARFVNGHYYMRQTPLVAGESNAPPPPPWLLKIITRIAPAFRRAERTAERALADRIWNDELERWNTEWRPQLQARCRGLAAVDVAELDDGDLAGHLAECVALAESGARLHFRLHISDLGPIGLLLVQARKWNLDRVQVMAALSGSSPATNAPATALAEIRDELANVDPAGVEEFGDLRAVRAASPRAAELLDEFLAEYGLRLTTGYDLRSLTLAEMPDTLLAALQLPDLAQAGQAAPEPTVLDQAKAAGAQALEALRAQLPADHHAELDRLVSEARALYGLRDENGPLTWQWPVGLIRRALLEAHRRLLISARIPDTAGGQADAIFDLAAAEIEGLLRGETTPTVSEILTRVDARHHNTTLVAPALLGREPVPPPLEALPPNLALLTDVIVTVIELIEHQGSDQHAIRGVGIGDTAYEGRACVVSDSGEALARMEPGDVLVAPYTVPTFNSVLAVAGAVVVDNGGLLCHAAVIAREYGIAGVVGTGSATTRIPDGATIRVDPISGTVELAGARSPTHSPA